MTEVEELATAVVNSDRDAEWEEVRTCSMRS